MVCTIVRLLPFALANERKINDYLDVLMFGTGEEIVEFFKMKRVVSNKL